jgi:hypothetical protein
MLVGWWLWISTAVYRLHSQSCKNQDYVWAIQMLIINVGVGYCCYGYVLQILHIVYPFSLHSIHYISGFQPLHHAFHWSFCQETIGPLWWKQRLCFSKKWFFYRCVHFNMMLIINGSFYFWSYLSLTSDHQVCAMLPTGLETLLYMTLQEKMWSHKLEFLWTMEYIWFFLSTDLESGHISLLTLTEVQNTGMANSITVLLHACALHCTA